MARPQLLDKHHARFLLRLPVDLFDDLSALVEKRKLAEGRPLSLNKLLNETLIAFFEAQPERKAVVSERSQYRRRRAAESAAKELGKTQRRRRKPRP